MLWDFGISSFTSCLVMSFVLFPTGITLCSFWSSGVLWIVCNCVSNMGATNACGFWALEMWLLQSKTCWESMKYTYGLKDSGWRGGSKSLINIFYIDFMLKWLYSGHIRLNILSKLISFIFMLLNVATRIVLNYLSGSNYISSEGCWVRY